MFWILIIGFPLLIQIPVFLDIRKYGYIIYTLYKALFLVY